MQCASCHFENMPGVEMCGRCGTSLRLATAVLDVHPPRAQPWVKRLRRLLPFRRVAFRLGEMISQAGVPLGSTLSFATLEPNILVRLVVPGWGQMALGLLIRGRVFLGLYLAFLLLGLVFFGTIPGGILLGLAFSVHASSVLDILFVRTESLGQRIGKAILITLALALVLYLPAGWLLDQVAAPRSITVNREPFVDGDVLLVNRCAYLWSEPEPGDVVAYRVRETRFNAIQGGPGNVIIQGGEGFDRILAGPGDRVRWDKGLLLVNGTPSPRQPLNLAKLPTKLVFDVPQNHYLILPTTWPNLNPQTDKRIWMTLSVVHARDIVGVVYLRHQPLSRWGFVR